MINIAFIDDGIIPTYFHHDFIGERVDFFSNDIFNLTKTDINHGTICALIFDKYSVFKKQYHIIDIRISYHNSPGYLTSFIDAIQWCVNNNIDIINISLGTTNHFAFDEIKKAISKAIKKGIIIIAAMSNQGIYTLPACLYGVIGVKTSTVYKNGNFKLRWYPLDGIEIVTSGQHIIEVQDGKFTTSNQNSFSAPVITAFIADIFHLYGKKNYDELLLLLESKATHVIGKHIDNYYPYFWNKIVDRENLKLWDKDLYTKVTTPYLIHRPKAKSVPVPLVSIWGRNVTDCIEFIKGLIDKLKDAYTYQIISDDILQIPDNIIIPYQCDISSFVSYVYDLFKPDILMLNLGAKYKADIYIYIDDEINISFDDETEKLKKFSLSEIELATVFTYNLLL